MMAKMGKCCAKKRKHDEILMKNEESGTFADPGL